jgi:hypothetical protein
MGGYIKWDKELVEDPRVLQIAALAHSKYPVETLGVAGSMSTWVSAVIGALVHLWTYADKHVDSADILTLSATALAAKCCIPEDILRTFPRTWIVIDDDRGTVKLPGYCLKNGVRGRDERKKDIELQREVWAAQKRAQRAKESTECPPEKQGGHVNGHVSDKDDVHPMSTPPPVPVPAPVPDEDKEPLTPQSGASAAHSGNGKANPRALGKNPRALGTNPRAVAARAAEDARWAPLLERAKQCGFREPWDVDSPETYETSLKAHERSVHESTPPAGSA